MDGLLIIDKPAGLTSHDVVSRVRHTLQQRRVGHTGTLDPFATGVLVVLVGRASRLAQFLNATEKEYEAIVRLGYATDTGDLTGTPVTHSGAKTDVNATSWSNQEIEAALEGLRGYIDQIPPMYSAKKHQGRKLYELARSGENIERSPVRVFIRTFEVIPGEHQLLKDNNDGTVDLAVHVVCSAGTYVRVLAENLGERLGTGAHLVELRRMRAGDFQISEAVSLELLKERVVEEALGTVLLPPSEALRQMPAVHLSQHDAKKVAHGIDVPVADLSDGVFNEGENVRMLDEKGRLLAIGCYDVPAKSLHPKVVIATD